VRIVDHRQPERARPIVRDHREPVVVQPPVIYPSTTYVESPYAAGYTYQPQPQSLLGASALDGRIQLDVTNKLAGDSTLRLSASGSGSTYISQVALYYVGGGSQLVTVQRNLDANSPTFEIPLGNGASLGGVVIDGHSLWGSALTVDAF
jgi:hypothetical protein